MNNHGHNPRPVESRLDGALCEFSIMLAYSLCSRRIASEEHSTARERLDDALALGGFGVLPTYVTWLLGVLIDFKR